jgi:hypothetical protein
MTDKSDHAGLLEAIISAPAAVDLEPAKESPKTRTITTDDGITWSIDDEGNGTRLTPVAKGSMNRRPVTMTRKFPPLVSTEQRSGKALLSAVAADPLKAQMLVFLLAADAPDRRSALYTLGTQWRLTDAEADLIVTAYLALKERMR